MFNDGVGVDLENRPRRPAQSPLTEADRMSAIGRMACLISHDMCHSLTAIYANSEFLERHDICASVRADLLLEIQEVVLAMTERLDSLSQFGSSGRHNPLVHERVSLVVEKAIAAVKSHPDGRNMSITIGALRPAKADIDVRSLQSAIYNLLLNACQAAQRSTHIPEVKVHVMEVDERIDVTILDNGPGIPASVRRTLFDPFVTAGKWVIEGLSHDRAPDEQLAVGRVSGLCGWAHLASCSWSPFCSIDRTNVMCDWRRAHRHLPFNSVSLARRCGHSRDLNTSSPDACEDLPWIGTIL
jgi:Histidine kinase-, DNA gyrase B-, and HSP90-like ATPase